MDNLTAVSGILFLVADIFAITSLSLPEWIVSDVNGNMRLGLTQHCQVIYGRPEICTVPRLSLEWLLTRVLISAGILCLTITCILQVWSHWKREVIKYSRWIAFAAMTLFCLAAVIFPVGFAIEEIGGQPYKLPNQTQVGTSYVLFILAIFFTVVSELFAGKVCLPMF
ncbi:uncharacterized protein C16orf52 homolog A-like [Dreissena polymorpha]|uniref:Modulator of smoothened n=1 Tax=Dreissena polymorpha TaxID=45954 RepID=A0A9D4LQ17_DREPO|nr:uncharacterized protein C16orf52 homolog A-like [Dreissena polymorpha]KAH3861759.1 hypothetical protein DPMN_024709 [Dreissena polymorpha]